MATPARKPSSGAEHTDEALDILRRLEPLLTRLDGEQRRHGETLARVEERLRDMPTAKEFGELKGRVSQLPTLWQLAGLIFAIFGAAFVLIRFASGH
ncbi:MAG: hypothetical protein WCO00_12025 [Rhodospirillaceae bacterium]